jgi:ankyrin repeat protein
MKSLITCIALLSFIYSSAQNNTFLDRSFWKSEPSITQIKDLITAGHDPTEKAPSAFDGVAYGIIDNAPLESIKYMLSLDGNPVTKPTHGGLKYLQWAAYKGNLDLMKHLLELGADPTECSSRGTNMLLMAAIGGVENTAVYDLILQQGIPLDYANNSGANALLLLAGSAIEDLSVFDYFMGKNISLDTKDNDGNNLFFYAARGGHLKTIKYWKQKGVQYKGLNDNGENAILFAAQGMRRQKLQLAVFDYLSKELFLEVDQVNWNGQSPLHYAVRKANPELLDFFISQGVSVHQIDNNGNTALINAASGSKTNLEKIAAISKDINHQNKAGQSAITVTIERRNKENFDFLLAEGANLSLLDRKGNDLLYYAFVSHRNNTENFTEHIIRTLQAAGIDGDKAYDDNNNLVHMAIEKQSVFLLEHAIRLGADVNAKNKMNISPLHLAAMKATNKDLISVLLAHGANKTALTEFNESPYDLAVQNEILKKENINLAFLKID